VNVTAVPPEGVTLNVSPGTIGALPGARRCPVHVTVTADADWTGRVVATLEATTAHPWWLIPGLFYGENRPAGCRTTYPRYAPGPPDPATMTAGHWSFRADRAATVAVFAWGNAGGLGLATTERSAAGLTGLGFGWADGTAAIHLSFPYAEAPWSYDGHATPRPPLSEAAHLYPGETMELDFEVYEMAADRHSYAPLLRALHDEQAPAHPLRPWMDPAPAADLTAEALWRWHYRPDPPVLLETAAFDRCIEGDKLDRQAMHVGWVSGIPWAYALLRHGRRVGRTEYVEAATAVLDFCCSALSESGTFYGTWYRDKGWRGSWTPLEHGVHARTLAEATLFLIRAWREETARGVDHPAWWAAVRSNLTAMLARQRADGNLGTIHDYTTGEVLSWDGAAGLAWVPTFLEAAEAAVDPAPDVLIAAAERAGHYYSTYVLNENIYGAPEDVDLTPTSEDGLVAVMAYVALHRTRPDPVWLDLARRSAEWILTFRYSYNVQFEPETILAQYGFATRGADQASVANQHLANYGLVAAAEMVELAGMLGEPWPKDRTEELFACFRQFIARRDGDFNARKGMVTERYYQTECFAPKGSLLTLSHAWCLGATLLAAEQYVDGWARLAPPPGG